MESSPLDRCFLRHLEEGASGRKEYTAVYLKKETRAQCGLKVIFQKLPPFRARLVEAHGISGRAFENHFYKDPISPVRPLSNIFFFRYTNVYGQTYH
jgi:hypothetical protein